MKNIKRWSLLLLLLISQQLDPNMIEDMGIMMGGQMGAGAFGKKFGQGQDFWNMLNGGLHFFG